ncbi:MAG: nucleotidyl transferase AbiEii/AbiGii toxin family protein [Acidobacteria bacterium]|nr:nucleotidyl transferase AbiEii/AbiGii toxin family protein [Acidobacteriota bacterium]
MTSLEAALRRIDRDLAQARQPFALVGGLAVSARTEPRFTRDADLAVAVGSDAEAEALVLGLRASGYRIASVLEQETVGRLATVRLAPTPTPRATVIDLLFASSGIEAEIVEEAETIELLPRLPIRVATVGHLIALKVLSRDDEKRPQDSVDLRALLRVASEADLLRARLAIVAITDRGYGRGRDLVGALNDLLRSAG